MKTLYTTCTYIWWFCITIIIWQWTWFCYDEPYKYRETHNKLDSPQQRYIYIGYPFDRYTIEIFRYRVFTKKKITWKTSYDIHYNSQVYQFYINIYVWGKFTTNDFPMYMFRITRYFSDNFYIYQYQHYKYWFIQDQSKKTETKNEENKSALVLHSIEFNVFSYFCIHIYNNITSSLHYTKKI